MATVKRLSSEYKLQTSAQNITLDTEDYATNTKASVIINGNLIVTGSTTDVEQHNLAVSDNIITLNNGETQNGVSLGYAGIEVDRGQQVAALLRWNEAAQEWEIGIEGNVAFVATKMSGNYITSVVEDLTPQLGGNLDVNGFSIGSSDPDVNVSFTSPIQVTTVSNATDPQIVANETLIYAAPSNGGGTGLYVANTEFQHQELVSKKKALAYALIF